MTTRTFLKTLCLVPIGAVVEKLPGQGISEVAEPKMEQAIREKLTVWGNPAQDGIRSFTVIDTSSGRFTSPWGNVREMDKPNEAGHTQT